MNLFHASAGTNEVNELTSLLDASTTADAPPEPPTRKGICASCAWFKEHPLKRWSFAVMLSFGLLTPIWILLRVTGSLTGDIVAGAAAVILAVYGANHFRILLGLTHQVGKYKRINHAFKKENVALEKQVNMLKDARKALEGISLRLTETTEWYEDNISKFRALDDKLNQLSVDNVEGMQKVKQMTEKVGDSFQKEVMQHARDILMKVFHSINREDEGLTEQEWNRFIAALPEKVQKEFDNLHFAEIAGDDGILCIDDFTKVIDKIVTEEALRKYNRPYVS